MRAPLEMASQSRQNTPTIGGSSTLDLGNTGHPRPQPYAIIGPMPSESSDKAPKANTLYFARLASGRFDRESFRPISPAATRIVYGPGGLLDRQCSANNDLLEDEPAKAVEEVSALYGHIGFPSLRTAAQALARLVEIRQRTHGNIPVGETPPAQLAKFYHALADSYAQSQPRDT